MQKTNGYMGTICGYCKECLKIPVAIIKLICGYYKECLIKPTAIMVTICGYCNEWRMSTIICALYAGLAKNAICQRLLWDSYAGIARNVKG